MKVKLGLSALDGRDLPSAYTPVLPASTPPAQADDPTVATRVAVAQMTNADGTGSDVYLLVEQSGSGYTLQYYDAVANVIYTGTDSATEAITLPANAGLDAVFTTVSVAGTLDSLRYEQADGSLVTPAALMAAGAPTAMVAAAAPPAPTGGPTPTDVLTLPFTWNEPKQTASGTSFSATALLLSYSEDALILNATFEVKVAYDIFGKPTSGSAGLELIILRW